MKEGTASIDDASGSDMTGVESSLACLPEDLRRSPGDSRRRLIDADVFIFSGRTACMNLEVLRWMDDVSRLVCEREVVHVDRRQELCC